MRICYFIRYAFRPIRIEYCFRPISIEHFFFIQLRDTEQQQSDGVKEAELIDTLSGMNLGGKDEEKETSDSAIENETNEEEDDDEEAD